MPVGFIALIGLIAQRKSVPDIVKGTVKTILGFIVLSGGAGVLLGSLTPLGSMFEHAFNVQGIIPNNEAIVSMALEKYGTATALIMAFSMVANIVVARFTRLKYIFLTGHHTFYMACMIGVILTVAGFEGIQLVFVGSLTLGLVMAFFPAIAHFYMKKITGSDDMVFGYSGTLDYTFLIFLELISLNLYVLTRILFGMSSLLFYYLTLYFLSLSNKIKKFDFSCWYDYLINIPKLLNK